MEKYFCNGMLVFFNSNKKNYDSSYQNDGGLNANNSAVYKTGDEYEPN